MESESISQSGSWHPSADPGLQGWPEPPGQHRGSSPQPEVIFGISKTHSVGHPHHQPCYFSLQPQHSSPHLWILRRGQTGVAWLHLRVPGKPESMTYYSCGNLKRKRHFAAKIVFLFQPEFLQNNNDLAVWAIAYWSSLVWLTWGVMMVVMGMAWWVEVTRVMKIGNNVKLGWIFEFLMIEEQKMRWFRWIAVVKLLIQRKEVELWIWVKSRKP